MTNPRRNTKSLLTHCLICGTTQPPDGGRCRVCDGFLVGSQPAEHDIEAGQTYLDGGDRVTTTGKPRRIAGGSVVRVTTVLWNGYVLPYCAVVTNLRRTA